MSDFTVASFCKITSGAAQLYSWAGRGTRVRSLCTSLSWLQKETQGRAHVLKDRCDWSSHSTFVHLPLKTSNLLELLETQLDPKLTQAACYSNTCNSSPFLHSGPCPFSHLIWLISLAHLLHSNHRNPLSVPHAKHITTSGLCTGGFFCPQIPVWLLLLLTELLAWKSPLQRGLPLI